MVALIDAHRFSPASSLTRVSVATQFTSQVLPPSSENACSKRQDSGVTSEITKRTARRRFLGHDLKINVFRHPSNKAVRPPQRGAAAEHEAQVSGVGCRDGRQGPYDVPILFDQ